MAEKWIEANFRRSGVSGCFGVLDPIDLCREDNPFGAVAGTGQRNGRRRTGH